MSTFEDIETQNDRRRKMRGVYVTQRYQVSERTETKSGRVFRAAVEPIVEFRQRTALHLFGPWAPELGPIRIEHHDGRVEHMSEAEATKRLGAWFGWTQEVGS